jgi:hypothetical protein
MVHIPSLQRHSPVAKEASSAKDNVSPVVATAKADTKKIKHYKPKVLARQRNNYGYGNALGYADESGSGSKRSLFPLIRLAVEPVISRCPSLSVIRLARDDNVLPAFRRRCLFAIVVPVRQRAHSVGRIGGTARELDLLPPHRDDGSAHEGQSRWLFDKPDSEPTETNSEWQWRRRLSARTASACA